VLRATLTYVRRKEPLSVASALATLGEDDIDFLGRHVQELRKAADLQNALLSRFQSGSGVPDLLRALLTADDDQFLEISAGLTKRLYASMDQATTPKPGVLAVIVTDAASADAASVLKLDAISEAASFAFVAGQVKLNVLRNLLPAPGDLQKGISLPDPRDTSDAVVIDRNQTAAQYFFNAFELRVSSTPREAEHALAEAIIQNVSQAEQREALSYAASLSGRAEDVAAQVQKKYSSVVIDRRELGAVGVPGGFIRPNKVATHKIRFRGDGIDVLVPHDRLDRITGPAPSQGGWELKIRFSGKPEVQSA
jgi:hypothetical protein